jgi:phage terminase small subunit
MAIPKLGARQREFCDNLLADLEQNATRAYLKTYPNVSESAARTNASRLLAMPKIQEYLEAAKADRVERVQIDADYVLKRLVEIDQMDVLDILDDSGALKPIRDWPRSWRTLISGFDVTEMAGGQTDALVLLKKIKWPDKVKNLELMGKHVNVRAWEKEAEDNSDDLASALSKLVDKLPG